MSKIDPKTFFPLMRRKYPSKFGKLKDKDLALALAAEAAPDQDPDSWAAETLNYTVPRESVLGLSAIERFGNAASLGLAKHAAAGIEALNDFKPTAEQLSSPEGRAELSNDFHARYERSLRNTKQRMANYAEDNPNIATAVDLAGYVAGGGPIARGLGGVAAAVPAVARLPGQMAVGAGLGAMDASLNDRDVTTQAALGAGVPVLGRVVSSVVGRMRGAPIGAGEPLPAANMRPDQLALPPGAGFTPPPPRPPMPPPGAPPRGPGAPMGGPQGPIPAHMTPAMEQALPIGLGRPLKENLANAAIRAAGGARMSMQKSDPSILRTLGTAGFHASTGNFGRAANTLATGITRKVAHAPADALLEGVQRAAMPASSLGRSGGIPGFPAAAQAADDVINVEARVIRPEAPKVYNTKPQRPKAPPKQAAPQPDAPPQPQAPAAPPPPPVPEAPIAPPGPTEQLGLPLGKGSVGRTLEEMTEAEAKALRAKVRARIKAEVDKEARSLRGEMTPAQVSGWKGSQMKKRMAATGLFKESPKVSRPPEELSFPWLQAVSGPPS